MRIYPTLIGFVSQKLKLKTFGARTLVLLRNYRVETSLPKM